VKSAKKAHHPDYEYEAHRHFALSWFPGYVGHPILVHHFPLEREITILKN